jgi:hypothetical protein
MLNMPCNHQPDPDALNQLLDEIESGTVRDEAQVLLDSMSPYSRPRRWLPPVCMIPDCYCPGEEHD